ncbi:hypothetical protein CBR_g48576 [Chara braunii]|uniref:C2 NT-type domain-containing protein n=1 Tax=Chara braunii TaxID=69332 RepID=A0A388M352_CHABU|nr:hypothetical protein CBR_g48576 [Chara braunii]|eukprot:GBG88966.1 hypothetical protein CBR_g48576 [Chara braunii]
MRVIRWPLRSSCCKKFSVTLKVASLHGLPLGDDERSAAVLVDVKWKGAKGGSLGSRFRRNPKRARTKLQPLREDSANWNFELQHECIFTEGKAAGYEPWEVCFVVRKMVTGSFKNGVCVQTPIGHADKLTVAGTAVMDLAKVASCAQLRLEHIDVPITCLPPFGDVKDAFLVVEVSLTELRDNGASLDAAQRSFSLPHSSDLSSEGKKHGEESSRWYVVQIKRIWHRLDPSHSQEMHNSGSELSGSDPDSAGEEDMADDDVMKSMGYNTIAGMNIAAQESLGSSSADDFERDSEADENAALTQPRGPFDLLPPPPLLPVTPELSVDPPASSTLSLLPWRKRKLRFRSPRARGKPLLAKSIAGDEGGDDIDWDRRHSDSAIGDFSQWPVLRRSASEGDISTDGLYGKRGGTELFDPVGEWETKLLASRDGHSKIQGRVFFASFDQRSESAAGESACTALVVVVADWLHKHPDRMPSRLEFDTLIREGSAEWRKLCEVEAYRARFPDRHFDLETIVSANVRPVRVVPEKSFVGFFRPEGTGESYDFLEGAMSFDDIWEEVEKAGPAIYIVSWNDHFFVLKVESSSKCYIIDTLGERLYEGCTCAYMLQFDGTGATTLAESSLDACLALPATPLNVNSCASDKPAADGNGGEDEANNSPQPEGEEVERNAPAAKGYTVRRQHSGGSDKTKLESLLEEGVSDEGAVSEEGALLSTDGGEITPCEGKPVQCEQLSSKERKVEHSTVEDAEEESGGESSVGCTGDNLQEQGHVCMYPLDPTQGPEGQEAVADGFEGSPSEMMDENGGGTNSTVEPAEGGEVCRDENCEKGAAAETANGGGTVGGDEISEENGVASGSGMSAGGESGEAKGPGISDVHLGGKGSEQGVGEGDKMGAEAPAAAEEGTPSGMLECCQFVKKFFAALPLRELETDLKKNLLGTVPLHQRLQIEFHYTDVVSLLPCSEGSGSDGGCSGSSDSENLIVL